MTNKTTLIIKISNTYKLQCSYIGSNKKEITIQLHNKTQQEGYPLSSSLIDKKSTIEFADDFFTKNKISNYMT